MNYNYFNLFLTDIFNYHTQYDNIFLEIGISLLYIILFSLIQGFTEFIPVSSQGHLVLYDYFFYVQDLTGFSILELNILAHGGSMIAILLYYQRLVLDLIKSTKLIIRPDIDRNANLLLNLIVACIPVFVAGYYFSKFFDYTTELLLTIISLSSIFFGFLIYFVDRFCLRVRNLDNLSPRSSFFIGLSQCLALVPGVSRSGAIITFMRFNGYTREHSVFFSNILAIPVIFGALTFLILDNYTRIVFDNFLNLHALLIFFFSMIFSLVFIHFLVLGLENFHLLFLLSTE